MSSSRPRLDIFRVLLVAIPLALVAISSVGYWVLNRTSDDIVARQAERISLSWAGYFGAELDRIEEIAAGASLSQSEVQFIEHAAQLGDVFQFKLFDRDGRLRLVSGVEQAGLQAGDDLSAHNEVAARVLAEGKPFTELFDGSGKPNRPEVYVESYAPIERDGKIVAIVEVYVDQTQAARIVRTDFTRFGVEIIGLTLLALLLPALALLRMSWMLRQRNRALRAEHARARAAEDRLMRAQRMEAIGQLTGGVAHDFNNLLAIIIGNSELLEDRLGAGDESLNDIFRAATRGSELIHHLLAFSRQQPLRPRTIDLGTLVLGMSELLKRTLGDTIDIGTSAAPGAWNASVDPGQVENALLNLALNARDAMPGGGKLTIACENAHLDEAHVARNPEAEVGDYVVLGVSDSGTGMSAEIREKAFEPFFTTKEVGEGSGLGLSMVYGFAKQSGGHATIDSKEGQGTTVKLYLPRARDVQRSKKAHQAADIPRGRGEVVLVIEDDPGVSNLAVKMLGGLGYRMLEAPDAAGARKRLANGMQVDLVLSDVVLSGGTSGPDFAEEARTTHPDLSFIFMSGYPAEAGKGNGFLDSDHVLLNKPFRRRQLAMAIREALD